MKQHRTLLWILTFAVSLLRLAAGEVQRGVIEGVEGIVVHSRANGARQNAVVGLHLNFGDRLVAQKGARATIRLNDLTDFQLREYTSIQLVEENGTCVLNVFHGALYLFSRDRPREVQFRTPHAGGGVRGTEYEVRVADEGTVVTLFDGAVVLTNLWGATNVTAGQVAVVEPGKAPRIPLVVTNGVQWWLHYPAILDLNELKVPDAAASELRRAITAWKHGDQLAAVREYPADRVPTTDAERLFLASLRLASGEVQSAELLLQEVTSEALVAQGIRELILSVTGTNWTIGPEPGTASGWLGRSYLRQARLELALAREAARTATSLDPEFGLAWARLAELEFSFGDFAKANRALQEALRLSPGHAPAHSLKGFLAAGRNQNREAEAAFDRAIQLDPSLGDGWLGRGLIGFRTGRSYEGLRDLQTAATRERQRSVLRSYLGKGFAEVNDSEHAAAEFALASRLDPRDPMPWLHSALMRYSRNQVNEAIEDLERSLSLNDERAVYRSRLLLDEDRAVRATSLARLYQRAGMEEVAVREAALAVSADYSNPGAHLFLADAFNALRDPSRFNLRYETAWFNELLLANALSSVESGLLSPSLSQQEYSKLFTRDGHRFSSFGEARSDGQIRQVATDAGVYGRLSYSVDLDWQHNDGTRINNDLNRTEVYTQLKGRIGDDDTLMVLAKLEEYEAGDNFQYQNPKYGRPDYRFSEQQHPNLVGIWRHPYGPGATSLLMVGRLENNQQFQDQFATNNILVYQTKNPIPELIPFVLRSVDYTGKLEVYVAEANQILESERNLLVAGGRFQTGRFQSSDLLLGESGTAASFGDSSALANTFQSTASDSDFNRISAYLYDSFRVLPDLSLTAGAALERMEKPVNFRNPPIGQGTTTLAGIFPKSALTWRISDAAVVRGMYAQSLGGVSLDESYRLEPVQLAGFSQAARTVIPESLVGSVSGHRLELGGAALDLKVHPGTYLGVQATTTRSSVDQQRGMFDYDDTGSRSPLGGVVQVEERFRFQERALALTANRLLGKRWSLGVGYQIRGTELNDQIPIAAAKFPYAGVFHEAKGSLVFNGANGLFLRIQPNLGWQLEHDRPGSGGHYAKVNLELGWRSLKQLGEVSIGVLNCLGDDTFLSPLSGYTDIPRRSVLFGRLRINF